MSDQAKKVFKKKNKAIVNALEHVALTDNGPLKHLHREMTSRHVYYQCGCVVTDGNSDNVIEEQITRFVKERSSRRRGS